jgi:hypothetical protein
LIKRNSFHDKQCARLCDEQETDDGSLVELKAELAGKRRLKAKVDGVLEKIRDEGLTRLNSTNPECVPTLVTFFILRYIHDSYADRLSTNNIQRYHIF